MRNWGVWDWISYACLSVGAIVLAADGAVKNALNLTKYAPEIMLNEMVAFVPLILVSVATAILLWRTLSEGKQSQAQKSSLEKIEDRKFANTVVAVDGKYFLNCTFSNVTFRYSGGAFYFVNAQLVGHRRFETQHVSIRNGVTLLKVIGLLNPEFAASWTDLPPEHFEDSKMTRGGI